MESESGRTAAAGQAVTAAERQTAEPPAGESVQHLAEAAIPVATVVATPAEEAAVGRRGFIDRFRRETIIIERKIVVPMSRHERKGGTDGTIHGRLSCLSPAPSQIDAADSCGKDVGFFGCTALGAADIGGVQHAVTLGVSYKGVHGSVVALGSVLFDGITLL